MILSAFTLASALGRPERFCFGLFTLEVSGGVAAAPVLDLLIWS